MKLLPYFQALKKYFQTKFVLKNGTVQFKITKK
jgi:hypothetical protein